MLLAGVVSGGMVGIVLESVLANQVALAIVCAFIAAVLGIVSVKEKRPAGREDPFIAAAAHQSDLQVSIYNVWKWQEKTPSAERFGNSPLWKARKKA
jgi:hypothetical protein